MMYFNGIGHVDISKIGAISDVRHYTIGMITTVFTIWFAAGGKIDIFTHNGMTAADVIKAHDDLIQYISAKEDGDHG